jgi:hypothetical protein
MSVHPIMSIGVRSNARSGLTWTLIRLQLTGIPKHPPANWGLNSQRVHAVAKCTTAAPYLSTCVKASENMYLGRVRLRCREARGRASRAVGATGIGKTISVAAKVRYPNALVTAVSPKLSRSCCGRVSNWRRQPEM